MREKAKDVEAYLAALPKKERDALERLRKIIKATAPKADEVISYQIPMYKQNGPLVSFAAFKDHLSFFVQSPSVMDAHKDDLKAHSTAKGTVHFTVDEPLPAPLVKKLVKARIDENEARAKSRK